MALSRQHDDTDVPELVGARCERLLAVPADGAGALVAVYLLAAGTWYRFFIDAQVLFLDESPGPDPADDLAPEESYVDLGCADRVIAGFRMRGGPLAVRFVEGPTLMFRETPGGTTVTS